jgi:hypothetical protein
MNTSRFTSTKKSGAVAAALALLISTASAAAAPPPAQSTSSAPSATTTQTKFYCNIKALTPDERARHQKLTDKLIAARAAIVETDRGYEFQFTPAAISLAELATWAVAESKCCPFFNFHLDLEKEGTLLCLGLTGEHGIKPFIRAEFQVPTN